MHVSILGFLQLFGRMSDLFRKSGASQQNETNGCPVPTGNPVYPMQSQIVGCPVITRRPTNLYLANKHTTFICWRATAIGRPVIHRMSGACFATGRPVIHRMSDTYLGRILPQRPHLRPHYKYPFTTSWRG